MRNRYGNRDSCIFLEFNRLVGTDAIFYPDGRLSDERTEDDIVTKVLDMRKRSQDLKLVGYSKRGSDKVYHFPQSVLIWANNATLREV